LNEHKQDKYFFRRAAGPPAPGSDSEVVARPHRRRFSAEYKLSIIDQPIQAKAPPAR